MAIVTYPNIVMKINLVLLAPDGAAFNIFSPAGEVGSPGQPNGKQDKQFFIICQSAVICSKNKPIKKFKTVLILKLY